MKESVMKESPYFKTEEVFKYLDSLNTDGTISTSTPRREIEAYVKDEFNCPNIKALKAAQAWLIEKSEEDDLAEFDMEDYTGESLYAEGSELDDDYRGPDDHDAVMFCPNCEEPLPSFYTEPSLCPDCADEASRQSEDENDRMLQDFDRRHQHPADLEFEANAAAAPRRKEVPLKVGDRAKAIENVYLNNGTRFNDSIRAGEVVTVSGVSEIGDLFFKEYPNETEPFPWESFVKSKYKRMEYTPDTTVSKVRPIRRRVNEAKGSTMSPSTKAMLRSVLRSDGWRDMVEEAGNSKGSTTKSLAGKLRQWKESESAMDSVRGPEGIDWIKIADELLDAYWDGGSGLNESLDNLKVITPVDTKKVRARILRKAKTLRHYDSEAIEVLAYNYRIIIQLQHPMDEDRNAAAIEDILDDAGLIPCGSDASRRFIHRTSYGLEIKACVERESLDQFREDREGITDSSRDGGENWIGVLAGEGVRVKVTGKVYGQGQLGTINYLAPSGKFAVVRLDGGSEPMNRSYHLSDLTPIDEEDEIDEMDNLEEGTMSSDAGVYQKLLFPMDTPGAKKSKKFNKIPRLTPKGTVWEGKVIGDEGLVGRATNPGVSRTKAEYDKLMDKYLELSRSPRYAMNHKNELRRMKRQADKLYDIWLSQKD
jgi:hypothetical protein